ncbi:MAG: phosphatidate cytidylyltransferase [Flavobacteriales bacterium]
MTQTVSPSQNTFSNLAKRAVFGALFLVITLASVWYSKYSLWAVFSLYSMGCLYEFVKHENISSVFRQWIWLSGLGIWSLTGLFVYTQQTVFLLAPVLLVPLLFLGVLRKDDKEPVFQPASVLITAILYTVLPFISLILLATEIEAGAYHFELICSIFLLIWANDTFAYVFGRLFGRHKLAPLVSPGKTWEGTIGGAAMTIGMSFVLARYITPIATIHYVVMCMILIPLGVLGDLVESKWKRRLGIKDSGAFLPGHGGFLDRFDSILLSAPVIFLYFYAVKTNLF